MDLYKRSFVAAGSLAALLLGATAAFADLRLTDPGSALYYNYGLVAATKLQVAEHVSIAGNAHSNGTLDVGQQSTVTGNLSSVGKLTNQGSVSGTVTSPAPALTLPVLASTSDLKLLANRVLSGNQTFTNAVINDVVFVDGDVTFQGSVSGVGTVIATHNIQVAEAGGGVTIPLDAATRMSFIALNDIQLSEGRALRGAFYAGRDATLSERASFEGVVIAQRNLSLGNYVVLRFLDLDQTPPVLLLQPADGALVNTARPTIQVSWSDDLSGVDLGTLRFLLDGANLTAQATVSATGLTFTPAQSLPEGAHTIEVTVADHSANVTHAVAHFTIDSRPPTVTITTPADGSYLADGRPAITATYSDSGVGVDLASVKLFVDGVDRTAAAQVTASGLTFLPASPLAEGAHTVTLVVKDLAGNAGQAAVGFTTDTLAPTLSFTAPLVPILKDQPAPRVTLTFADSGSGIVPASFRLRLEGADVTATCTLSAGAATCQLPTLSTAANDVKERHLAAEVRDRAGNVASASLTLIVIMGQGDVTPPQVIIAAPADGAVVGRQPVNVSGLALDDGVIARLTVGGTPVSPGGTFAADVPLHEGQNTIEVRATDGTGKVGVASILVKLDTTPPILTLDAPADGTTTNGDTVVVRGRAVDPSGDVAVTVAGIAATVSAGDFQASVPLADGANSLEVRAVDPLGNVATRTVTVNRVVLPRLTIDSPADLSVTSAATVTVTGTVDDPAAVVTVNDVPATVAAGRFTARGVAVGAGPTQVTARAIHGPGTAGLTNAAGTATITVIRDTQAPFLSVYRPASGAVVTASPIAVQGFVSDTSDGALDPPQVAVTVNGLPATVSKDTFFLSALPLQPGANTLTVAATDAAGNVKTVTVPVTFDATPVRRLQIVSGDGQSAPIGTRLPAPLVVQVLDAGGLPVARTPVLFSVKGSDGAFPDGRQKSAVTTDADGRAAIDFTLGTRAGTGNQAVEAFVAGYAGATFYASGLTGPPALLVVDSGDQQIGVTGQRLPQSFAAVVTDSGFNRLPGVAVHFKVIKGGGAFDDGTSETVVTDRFGRAVVGFRLGTEEGASNNMVEATLPELPGQFAGFTASGKTAGPPEATTISGVVLDNSNQPVPGATLRLRDTSIVATSDSQGVFKIANAPIGPQLLIVDGSTVTRPGVWPDLEFAINDVPGRDNTIGMPIFLLPIDMARGLQVSETEGGTITLPEWPGFALTIAPGSVTFPGGGRSGVVSVTQVHPDKIPMVPNFGQQPRFIVSIQPAGARFDPPARLSLPNLEGLPPGAVTEMYSFDHDLARFVSIGPATVSEDGTIVQSNPGVGVVKAGWHCGGNPSGSGTPHDCPVCNTCVNATCTPDDGQAPPQTAPDDCLRQICYAGTVRSVPDITEIPLDLVGNCSDGICTGAGPALRTNLADAPPGQQCCDTGRGSGGSPFDPQQKCCEAPNLLNKYPMPSSDQCPDKVARPGHVPGAGHTLGCGPEAADWTIPDNPNIDSRLACFGPSFFPACVGHDICYDSCGNLAAKDACDTNFRNAMMALCDSASIQCRSLCRSNAQLYYEAVHLVGGGPYESGQEHACQCCP